MLSYRRVLVATDLSEPADEAIRQAHAWANATGAELVVCHVVANLMSNNMLFPQLAQEAATIPELFRQAEDAVSARVVAITGRAPAAFGVVIAEGAAHREIVSRAEAIGADLIVVGGRGHSGIERVLGSVADKVVRLAHSPVLVARPFVKSGVIVVATDFSPQADVALATAADEAKRRGARLLLVHGLGLGAPVAARVAMGFGGAFEPLSGEALEQLKRDTEKRLQEELSRVGCEGETRVVEEGAAIAAVEVAEEVSAELIAMGTTGRTGLRRLALGSVAETVVRTAPGPVLVVRAAGPVVS